MAGYIRSARPEDAEFVREYNALSDKESSIDGKVGAMLVQEAIWKRQSQIEKAMDFENRLTNGIIKRKNGFIV